MDLEKLRVRLLTLAGYSNPGPKYRSNNNFAVHDEFRAIIGALVEIAERKVDGYGPFRYDELTDDWRWESQSLYQDIERKFGRLKTLMKPNPISLTESDQLLDVLSDLAVYSARGIQIIERMKDKLYPIKEIQLQLPDTTKYKDMP
jgi:hypothetical protein